MVPPSPLELPSQSSIDLAALGREGSPGWEPFNGAAFRPSPSDGPGVVASRPGIGTGDRGAFLEGIDFAEGAIEVELKGSANPQGSFLGLVFHGIDGETYDSVYFRPFNFGSSDPVRRGHAVQYMSPPDWPWNELRRDRPEEFENPADPEPGPTDWFAVRVEVTNQRIRVFVDGATRPCLDVEKLGSVNSGKVGLWFNGIASFRNFRVQPSRRSTP